MIKCMETENHGSVFLNMKMEVLPMSYIIDMRI